jgi:hypothetical protein
MKRFRETLNKCSFSTTGIDKVASDEISKPTEDTGDDDGIRAVYEKDAAGNLFRRDGADGAVGKVVRLDRAALSEARKRATAERTGKDAADLFSAAVVQSGGPGGGRGLVRLGDAAAVRGH